ncbi:MAG: hypothetical protein QCH35_02865 [Methanomicrobiaceae archaeon]|nr:hypothetical protein [Methanomicrobiaceae archaeon]
MSTIPHEYHQGAVAVKSMIIFADFYGARDYVPWEGGLPACLAGADFQMGACHHLPSLAGCMPGFRR